MSNEQLVKNFLTTAKNNAAEILGQAHVGEDVKSVVKDLLQICQNFQDLSESSTGQSADVRVLKKRFEQAKLELRLSESKLATAKQLMIMASSATEGIVVETLGVLRRHPSPETDPDFIAGNKIKAHSKKLLEAILQVSAMSNTPT